MEQLKEMCSLQLKQLLMCFHLFKNFWGEEGEVEVPEEKDRLCFSWRMGSISNNSLSGTGKSVDICLTRNFPTLNPRCVFVVKQSNFLDQTLKSHHYGFFPRLLLVW